MPMPINTQDHRLTTHPLVDESENFPSSFSDKTSVEKNTINGDDNTTILSKSLDVGNKIIEYSLLHTENADIHFWYY